jgi:hypothetical protein
MVFEAETISIKKLRCCSAEISCCTLYYVLGTDRVFLLQNTPSCRSSQHQRQDSRGYSRSKPWNTLKRFAIGQHQFEDLAKKHHLITNNWIRLNYFQNVNSFCIMVPDPCIHSNLLQFESWLRWTRAVSASLIRNLRHWLVPNGLWKKWVDWGSSA